MQNDLLLGWRTRNCTSIRCVQCGNVERFVFAKA